MPHADTPARWVGILVLSVLERTQLVCSKLHTLWGTVLRCRKSPQCAPGFSPAVDHCGAGSFWGRSGSPLRYSRSTLPLSLRTENRELRTSLCHFHFHNCFQTCTSVWIFLGVGRRV